MKRGRGQVRPNRGTAGADRSSDDGCAELGSQRRITSATQSPIWRRSPEAQARHPARPPVRFPPGFPESHPRSSLRPPPPRSARPSARSVTITGARMFAATSGAVLSGNLPSRISCRDPTPSTSSGPMPFSAAFSRALLIDSGSISTPTADAAPSLSAAIERIPDPHPTSMKVCRNSAIGSMLATTVAGPGRLR